MEPSLSLVGRTALVCGASSGIGRATALLLASRGATTAVLARREPELLALREELLGAGAPDAPVVIADMEDPEDLRAKVGGLGAEILIHNTGGPPGGPLLEAEPAALSKAFQRHVLSAQTLLRLMLPTMVDRGYGRIVTVTSTSVREPIPNLGVSNTIRGAMASWAKSVANELPPGVTINNVMPGFTDTQRLASLKAGRAARTGVSEADVHATWLSAVPEGRLARPEEVASMIAYLCSEAGAYVRGQSIAVDGGRLRSI